MEYLPGVPATAVVPSRAGAEHHNTSLDLHYYALLWLVFTWSTYPWSLVIISYYGLFWTWSPYLDLQWRSRSTGNIPELLITSILRHKNKNRWVGDHLWRSCSLFCVVIFHSSFGLMTYPYTKQFTWSPQGIPHSPVLVIRSPLCSLLALLLSSMTYYDITMGHDVARFASLWRLNG